LLKSKFYTFYYYFCDIFLILYHFRKHNNFQLNRTEGVAYRNSKFFWLKFEAPSRLWVRCLRSRIWTSTRGKTWLGRHNGSQRKKNTTRSTRKFNGARHGVMALLEIQILHILLLFFWYFFEFCITQIESTTIFSSIGKKVWPIEIPQF
jgi:hypothetical protein